MENLIISKWNVVLFCHKHTNALTFTHYGKKRMFVH